MKTVVITGANSFWCSRFANESFQRSWEIFAVVREVSKNIVSLQGVYTAS